jgi:hypothetical protein
MTDPILTIKDVPYRVADLPPDIQQLIRIYQRCENKLIDQRDEVFLTEVSLKTLGVEIEMRMKKFSENNKLT